MEEFSNLPGPYVKAIQMKYEGHTHAAIAKVTNVAENTVDKWFERESVPGTVRGRLRTHYEQYKKVCNQQALQEASDLLKSSCVRAVQTQTALLASDDIRIQFAAAKDIMDRTIGRPTSMVIENKNQLLIQNQINIQNMSGDELTSYLQTNYQKLKERGLFE